MRLIEIPDNLSRFLVLPETNNLKFIILLDDIIRYAWRISSLFLTTIRSRLIPYSLPAMRSLTWIKK